MSKKTNTTNVPIHGRFHFKSILPKFSDTAVALLDGDLGSVLRAFSGALGGKNDEPEAQAYTLLWQCMKEGVRRIFEHRFREESDVAVIVFGYTQQFRQDLWKALPDMDLIMDRDFIHNPMQHSTTITLQNFLKVWMQGAFKIEEPHAQVASALFPRYLLQEMAVLARTDFKQLFEHFEKPFLPAEEKALAFDTYETGLMSEFDRPAFGNRQVSLAEMYVPPYFRFYKPKKEEGEPGSREIFHKPTEKILLKDFLNGWLSGKCPDDTPRPNARVMLLLGQPGQGKSSFCQSTAFDLLSDNQGFAERVFVVRLRDFENRQEFLQKPLQVVLEFLRDRKFKKNGLDASDLRNGLLILDGLDEFYMNNGLSHRDVDDLLNNLVRDLRLEAEVNTPANPFRCLITSRNNYVRLENHHTSDLITVQIAEMALEEQQQWLGHYEKTLHLLPSEEQTRKSLFVKDLNVSLEKLNASTNENEKKFLDLVNQPILLQIVVEAEADPIKSENRAKLYEDLFNHLVQRKWAKEGQITSLKGLANDDKRGPKLFRQFLRALAAHIFYSEREYARRSDFLEEPLKKAVADLKKLFPNQQEEDYLKNLMVSFYFKEVRKDSDDGYGPDERANYAYEFLHKSLQEYLVAEYCWSYFRETLTETNKDEEYIVLNEAAAKKTFELFSPKLLTVEVVNYIYELVRNEFDLKALEQQLFPRTKTLMNDLALHSFLWSYDAEQTNSFSSKKRSSPLEKSVSVFYGILTINGALVSKISSSIQWPDPDELDYEENIRTIQDRLNFLPNVNLIADFLILLRRHDSKTTLTLIGCNLSKANLDGANLNNVNFSGANLSRTSLNGVSLFDANLTKANLSYAYLEDAHLPNAILYGTNLYNTYLFGATLHEVILDRADLSFAIFNNANLYGSILTDAICKGTDFTGAYLVNINFYNSNFEDAVLADARFTVHSEEDTSLNLDKIINLSKAKGKNKADWRGTIYEGKVWDEPEEEEE